MSLKGKQIIYVPCHAGKDKNHPDCEPGFIAEDFPRKGNIFCRYWSKTIPGELRTKANSESTPFFNLVFSKTRPQDLVDKALEKIEEEKNVI